MSLISPIFSEGRAPCSDPEAAAVQDQAVPPVIAEAPKALTFAELQTLIEQGKTDEIPNNKHIPDAINVVFILRYPNDDVLSP
jgi:hypothetical protein